MPSACDREGTYRGHIVAYGLKEMDSGSVAVSIRVALLQLFADGVWHAWSDYDMEAEGDIWIVKRDGTVNQGAAESLMRHAGWDGSVESVANETWQPTQCQVSVKASDYKGVSRLRVEFVNDFDRTPGGMSNVSPEKARELAARHGGALRALAGNVRRNVPATPAGKPAAPSRPATKPPAPAPVVEEGPIPF